MREPGSDGNLNVMFFINFQIMYLMTLLTNDLVFLIYCQEHRSSVYVEFIRKHDKQVSTYS